MSETFYTILTTVGQAKIANAQVTGQKVNLTEIAVGDGGGSYYNPDQTQTSLKNEIWRGNIGSVQIDEENPNWIVIEGVVPATVGGFFVREVGIFDDAGDMVAIGKFPETYKPVMEQGSAKDLYLRVIIEVANASAVTLRVDPSVIIASRKYVDEKIGPVEQKANQNAASILQLQQQVNAHLNDFAQVWSNRIVEMGSNANGTYVRWENGLQICWAGRSVINWPEQTTPNQGSSYYASDFTWTFPASFIDANVIITASPGFAGTGGAWGVTTIYHDSVTTTSVRLRLWTTHSREDISNGTTVAIGRWK